MINAVGREIPEEILKITGKEGYQGAKAKDNCEFTRGDPRHGRSHQKQAGGQYP